MRAQHRVLVLAVAASCAWWGSAQAAPPTAPSSAQPRVATPLLAATVSEGTRAVVHAPAAGGAAQAKPNAAQAREERKRLLDEARAKLELGEADAIDDAFARLREAGGAEAATLVATRLRRGLPPHLTDAAIDALVALGQPSASPVLLELALHRRWQVRQKAVSALGALKVKTAQSALLFALDDPSPEVRAAAVEALGAAGDKRAVPALVTALERGADGAVPAIGKLGGTKEAELLIARAKAKGPAAAEAGLTAMLGRRDVNLVVKRRIIADIAALGTPEATASLAHWLDALAASGDPAVVDGLRGALGAARASAGSPAAKATASPSVPSSAKAAAPTEAPAKQSAVPAPATTGNAR